MIKRIIATFLCGCMIFVITGCENQVNNSVSEQETSATTPSECEKSSETETESNEPVTESNMELDVGDVAVVYFSATGNTKFVAQTLAELQDVDIYEIVPQHPYTDEDLNYNDQSSRCIMEQNDEDIRPAISSEIDDIDNYDLIYIGYPIWGGDMPRILYTFFDTYDLSGKIIAPFCTSGGSGLSGTVQTISELEPAASIIEGLHIRASSIDNAESVLEEWIADLVIE